MDEEDEELEIIPHVKGSTDFEIYDQVVIKPTFTLLPWDDNVKPNYTLNYKVRILMKISKMVKPITIITFQKNVKNFCKKNLE